MRNDDLEVLDLNIDDEELSAVEENLVEENKKKADEDKPDTPEAVDKKKELISWIVTLTVTVVVVLFVKNFIIINATVPTGSMENTIMPGDNLFGLRVAYAFDEPERGDIIFFYFPDDESQKYVKRIIGLPGETVYISEGKIFIDGSETPLEEPYLKEEWIYGTGPYMFEVPEGCYFVLGDNRNNSVDSRYWVNSYVAEEKIIGKAIFTYFPFEHWGVLE